MHAASDITITNNKLLSMRNYNKWSYVLNLTVSYMGYTHIHVCVFMHSLGMCVYALGMCALYLLQEMSMCGTSRNKISIVTIEACNHVHSNCVNISGVLSFTDGVRRVMATFDNLEENRKYSASVHVQYNGGVVQQSQPVEISELHNVHAYMHVFASKHA